MLAADWPIERKKYGRAVLLPVHKITFPIAVLPLSAVQRRKWNADRLLSEGREAEACRIYRQILGEEELAVFTEREHGNMLHNKIATRISFAPARLSQSCRRQPALSERPSSSLINRADYAVRRRAG